MNGTIGNSNRSGVGSGGAFGSIGSGPFGGLGAGLGGSSRWGTTPQDLSSMSRNNQQRASRADNGGLQGSVGSIGNPFGTNLFGQNRSSSNNWRQQFRGRDERDTVIGRADSGNSRVPIGTIGQTPSPQPQLRPDPFGVSAAEAMLMTSDSGDFSSSDTRIASNPGTSRLTGMQALDSAEGEVGGEENYSSLMSSISSLISDMRVPESEKQHRIRLLQQQHRESQRSRER